MKIVTIVKWLLATVAVLAVLLLAGGLLLPASFKVTRSVVVNAAPDTVYALVADPRRWKEWSVWTKRDPAMAITYFGAPSGTGAGWSWQSKAEGDGRMTFSAAEPPRRIAYELFFPDFGTASTGDFRFTPDAAGTRVVWSMDGNIGNNPLYRWFALFADSMVGKDFDGGLAGLKALAEKG